MSLRTLVIPAFRAGWDYYGAGETQNSHKAWIDQELQDTLASDWHYYPDEIACGVGDLKGAISLECLQSAIPEGFRPFTVRELAAAIPSMTNDGVLLISRGNNILIAGDIGAVVLHTHWEGSIKKGWSIYRAPHGSHPISAGDRIFLVQVSV